MEYVITIDKFEGPLDLLLHLIKQADIDIYDIKIDQITSQYLDYINKMESLSLDIASTYLVMAAELIEIKASMLLPKQEVVEDEFEEDPKERLIKRLIEYQNYKDMTPKFHELELDRKEYFTKEPSDITDYEISGNLPDDVCLDDLIKAFENFLNRKETNKPLNTKITSKEYSVSVRSKEICDLLKKKKKVVFSDLFEIRTKSYVIVTFLSILALAKSNDLKIMQDNNFDEIILCGVEE